MKAIESLLAVSALAALGTGVANAATVATYDVAVTPLDIIYHFPEIIDSDSGTTTPAHLADIMVHPLSYGISGTAVLDDAGTLTITSTYRVTTALGTDNDFGNVVTFHGSWNGTTFTAASASQRFTSCWDNGINPLCSSLPMVLELSLTDIAGSTTASSGSFTATWLRATNDNHYQYVLSNGMPAVPVPAAAWLFGSALMSMFAGINRRRHTT